MNSYKAIFRALDNAGVKYIIVGGVAMNLHGCPRFTNDIDILLALDAENIGAMKQAMDALGYEQRLPVSLDELGDERKAVRLIQENNLIAFTYQSSKDPLYSIDVIVGPSLRFDEFEEHRMLLDVWELALPVVSIDDLIGLKKDSGREKDALDVAMLLEYKGL